MPPPTVHPSPEGGLVAMPDLVLPPGTLIDEFEIQGQLGVGGFGVVYRAFDRALERTVAIKEYLPQQSATRVAGVEVVLRLAMEGAGAIDRVHDSALYRDPEARHSHTSGPARGPRPVRGSSDVSADTGPSARTMSLD